MVVCRHRHISQEQLDPHHSLFPTGQRPLTVISLTGISHAGQLPSAPIGTSPGSILNIDGIHTIKVPRMFDPFHSCLRTARCVSAMKVAT